MTVQSAQSVTVLFTTRVFATGVGTNADSLPTGTLYKNGIANAATVTVTNLSTGLYKAQVTLPTLAFGDEVQLIIAATVSTISDTAVVWGDTNDILVDANNAVNVDVKYINAIATTSVTAVEAILGQANEIATDSSGRVILQPTQTGVTIPTVTTVTNQLTAAAIATSIWQDVAAGDFTVASSIGKSLYTSGNVPGAASGIALVGSNVGTTTSVPANFTAATFASAGVFSVGALANAPTGGSAPTAAQIATAVWQDTTSGDFTVASSIGKSLYTSGNAPGAASGIALVGSNMGTVSSVTGSVGSIAGITFPTHFSAILISAAGNVGIDWSNVSNPTATVGLSGTTVGTLTTYTGNTPQTGDSYARIGALGAGLTALAPSATALSTATWTNTLATDIATIAGKLPVNNIADETIILAAINALVAPDNTHILSTYNALTALIVSPGVFSTAALQNAPSGGGGGGGAGSFTLTVTVQDTNSVPLQNALVTLKINASTYTATTNVSGIAVLNPNEGNGTYGIRLTCSGYQFTPTTVVVAGDTAATYQMTILNITPSTPPYVTLYGVLYDSNGNAVSGATVNLELLIAPGMGRGDGTGFNSQTSGSNGLVQFVNCVLPLGTYNIQWMPDGDEVEFVTTADAEQEFPNIRQG